MRKFTVRSLSVLAGALLLTPAFAPSAKAAVIAYFNFEDPPATGQNVDYTSEFDQGLGINTTIQTNYITADTATVSPGLADNRLAADTDVNNFAAHLFRSSLNSPADFDIPLFSSQGFFQNMTVSFGVHVLGNGFDTVKLYYNTTGCILCATAGNFTLVDTKPITTMGAQTITFASLPAAANNQPLLVVRLEFSGGHSNGVDAQDIIDNVLIGGTIVPEPTTIGGGLLGVLGLCWFQRRRLIRCLRLRPT